MGRKGDGWNGRRQGISLALTASGVTSHTVYASALAVYRVSLDSRIYTENVVFEIQ